MMDPASGRYPPLRRLPSFLARNAGGGGAISLGLALLLLLNLLPSALAFQSPVQNTHPTTPRVGLDSAVLLTQAIARSGHAAMSHPATSRGLSSGGPIGTTVSSTLDLVNGSFQAGAATTFNGLGPQGDAYARSSNELFVADSSSNAVTVLNASSGVLLALIPVGFGPVSAAFDSTTGYVYVVNDQSVNISVINPISNRVVTSLSLPSSSAYALTVDTTNGMLYVGTSSDVLAIDPTGGSVHATIPVGNYVTGLAFDPSSGDVYVAVDTLNQIAIIDAGTNAVIKTLAAAGYPVSVCYDSLNGYVYVGNTGLNNITVVNGATNSVVGFILTYGPAQMFVDPSNGELYVAAYPYDLTAFDTATGNATAVIIVGSFPTGIALNSLTGDLLVTNARSENVSFVNPTTQRVVGTYLIGASVAQAIAIPSIGGVAALDPSSAQLYFIDRAHRLAANYSLPDNPDSIAFDTQNGLLYVSGNYYHLEGIDPRTGGVVHSFMLPGSTILNWIVYDPDTHLIIGADDYTSQVFLVDPLNGTLVANATVGRNPNTLALDPNSDLLFVGNAYSNNISVFDAAHLTLVATLALPSAVNQLVYDPADGSVYGVSAGNSSLLLLDGSTGAVQGNLTVSFNPVGLYYDPSMAAMWVLDGGTNTASPIVGGQFLANWTVAIPATPTLGVYDAVASVGYLFSSAAGAVYALHAVWGYPVQFYAVGPTVPGVWSLTVGNLSYNVTGRGLGLQLGNGTYNFSIQGSTSWLVSPGTGSFRVSGASVNLSVEFSPRTFGLRFNETGLPGAVPWEVTVNGSSQTAIGRTLLFALPTGSYGYFVSPPTGYASSPPDGVLSVNTSTLVLLTFTVLPKGSNNSSTPPHTGSSNASATNGGYPVWLVGVLAGAALVLAVALAAVSLASRRSPPGPPTPPGVPPAAAESPPPPGR
ncbi:MAG: YncE family protein [Thermoplasmata archaeon]|nr:YncE family protein [Thermoplasmata archaeon]